VMPARESPPFPQTTRKGWGTLKHIARHGLFFQIANALEDGADDKRKSDGGVFENFGELAAFFGWDEFAPANSFGVGAAAETAPVHRLGTDADAVVIALQGKIFVTAAGHEFSVDTELLGPVARHTAADCENAHFFGGHHGVREGLEIFERIEAKRGALLFFARVLIEGKVEAKFRIGEGGDENGDVVLVGGFENAAVLGIFDEKFADALVKLPAANDFIGIPFVEDAVDNLFDVIEVGFGFEGIIDAVVAGEEECVVVHFGGIVTEMGTACSFDEPVGHERAGGNDGFDNAGFDEVAEDETHLADGESAGEGHDDETIFVASHIFEDVGGVADLTGSIGGVAHGTNKIVDGLNFGKIERIDGAELVFDGIVENTTCDGFAGLRHERNSL
jgi:hypothetical protein